ncbi:ligand-binding sensor domain-containing protein, partial [Taibaiella chishuiensis]
MRSLFLLLCILLPVSFRVHAQAYSYSHYDTGNGLPGSTVYCIAQTKDGFIWFGTEAGLCRFDGVNFKTFTMEDGLPANDILTLHIDSRGRIWIKPFKTAICYYENGKIHNQQNDTVLKKIVLRDLLNCIAENDRGDIIIQEQQYTHVISPDNRVSTLPAGSDFLGQRDRLPLYNIVSDNNLITCDLVRFPPAVARRVGKKWYYSTTRRINGKQYYVFNDGYRIRVLAPDGQEAWTLPLPHPLSYTVFIDSTQVFIYRHGKGIDLLQADHFTNPVRYFPDYYIDHVLLDLEQNLWFATKGAGVFKISPNRFRNLFAANEKGTTYIRHIHKLGSDIYIAGLNNLYWKTQPVHERFFHNDAVTNAQSFRVDHSFLGRIPDRTLIHNSSSNFLNLKRFGNDSISYCKTIQVFGDTLLVASHYGIFLFNWKNNHIDDVLFPGRTSAGYKLRNDYYIGTLNGLYLRTADGRTRFLGEQFPVFRSQIATFAESADGTLWVGTNGSGIIGYRNNKICAVFNTGNGLASAACRCLYADGNTLWAGTEKGLCKIDITPGNYRVANTITANDGLNSSIINAVYSDSCFVYVGTPLGLTMFDERNVRKRGISYINMTAV